MSTGKSRREVTALLRELGCTEITHSQGRHTRWHYKTPGGNPGTTTTSLSASDHRAMQNIRTVIRNEIRTKDGSQ